MNVLQLKEEDIQETFYAGSGPGGQKRAKTASGVALLHLPTGVRVRCQRERSQGINRFLARRILVEELEAREKGKTRHQVKAQALRDEKLRKSGAKPKTKKPTITEMEKHFHLRLPGEGIQS